MSAVCALLDLFYPPKCVLCGRLLVRGERDFCTPCRLTLPVCTGERDLGPEIAAAVSALWYEDAVREALRRFKFEGKAHYAGNFAPLLAAASARLPLKEIDVVTWVPVSRKRRRERGYDQVYLLAKPASRALEKPLEAVLEKYRDNPPQSSLENAGARRTNVEGVYRTRKGARLAGRSCLLIDDILTTGSTARAAARVLLAAGAEAVFFASVASARLR